MTKRRRRTRMTIEDAEVLSDLCHLEQNTVIGISKRRHLERNKIIGISNFCDLERDTVVGISNAVIRSSAFLSAVILSGTRSAAKPMSLCSRKTPTPLLLRILRQGVRPVTSRFLPASRGFVVAGAAKGPFDSNGTSLREGLAALSMTGFDSCVR